jgi:Fe2+ or Zn2+ uptake regulation protein
LQLSCIVYYNAGSAVARQDVRAKSVAIRLQRLATVVPLHRHRCVQRPIATGGKLDMLSAHTPGRLRAELISRGIRMTAQRHTILGVIESATQHLDAAQILRKARKLNASVDRVTVYRTLALLKRHGLIDELDLMHVKGEGHYYEERPKRDHVHMTCLRCAAVAEFESDLFERLQAQVQKECSFHIVVSRLEIGGYCSKCRRSS